MSTKAASDKVRLDKFLWAARFYKTRSLAAEEIDKGRVEVNGAAVKPAREVKLGDELRLRQGVVVRVVRVLALSGMRGPAALAQTLFAETPQSIAARERAAEQRRLAPEPALAQTQGRPTKRDRRDLQRAKENKDWDKRWSASLDDAKRG